MPTNPATPSAPKKPGTKPGKKQPKSPSKKGAAAKKSDEKRGKAPKETHFFVLLDRSGSMDSMRADVIGGFNAFLAEQRNADGRARMTLVQFDSQDPQEVVFDSAPLEDVKELTERTFAPRGGTPLLDATALLIERALGRQALQRALNQNVEEIVFITITDGEENQSRRMGLEQVRTLIDAGKAAGWNFVFLGAGIDAYAEARRLGYHDGSIQAFAADGEGADLMWKSVSRASTALRSDLAHGRDFDKAAYFRGLKEAEARRQHPA